MPSIRPGLGVSEAMAHVRARSFPEDSSDLTGLELEWLMQGGVGEQATPAQYEGSQLGEVVLLGGSALSVEPGGQLELSSQPHSGLAPLCSAVSADVHALSDGVADAGGFMFGIGLLPDGPASQRLSTPRYDAMAEFFAADGTAGSTMMTSTASLQVNIGAGTGRDRETRWRRANMLGPVLAASFANSPLAAGIPTGCASNRLGVWSAIDPSRTASGWHFGQGCESWPA